MNDNQIKVEPDELPELYFPEIAADLFSRPDANKHYPDKLAASFFFKHLMSGFTATNHGMLVTLLDKEDSYKSAESYSSDTSTPMHPFCACLRGQQKDQCRMRGACMAYDRMVADTIIHEKPGHEHYQTPYICHAGMLEMAVTIRIADRPFAVLLSGQIVPKGFNQEKWKTQLLELLRTHRPELSEEERKEFSGKLLKCITDSETHIQRLSYSEDEIGPRWLSLNDLAEQLETVFNNMYQTIRNYSEERILAAIRERLKKLGFIEGKYPLGNVLKQLSQSLGLKGILLLRGADKMKPLHSMELIAFSGREEPAGKKMTISLYKHWNMLVSEKISHEDKWKMICPEIFRMPDLRHSMEITTGIVVVNDYQPHPSLDTLSPQNTTPLLLLGIGQAVNSGIAPFLRHVLREFETVIDLKYFREEIKQLENETRNQITAFGHRLARSVQSISNSYYSIRKTLRRSPESFIRKVIEEDLPPFKEAIDYLNDAVMIGRGFASNSDIKVPLFEFNFQKKDLVPVIDETIKRIANVEQRRHIQVKWKNKPPYSANAATDERLFQLAIEEALSNAIKYSYSDWHVRVSLKTKGHFWLITIKNFGVGIPEDKLEEIFLPQRRLDIEPVYYGSVELTEREGIGMGMAYIKAVIEGHGGFVQITSTPGPNALHFSGKEREAYGHHTELSIFIPRKVLTSF